MAIISISRQLASFGDEIASQTAKKLGYRYICRRDFEERILKLGFPSEQLKKFDERKPGFFASLTRNRDQYIDHLKTAVYEFALEENCVFVGRGTGFVLDTIENHISVRFMSDLKVRIKRVMDDYCLEEKAAAKMLKDADRKQAGYYKSFFEADIKKAMPFHLVLNTGILDIESASNILVASIKEYDTAEREKKRKKRIEELLIAQRIVNMLLLDYDIAIHFLRAEIDENNISLYGIADSSATVERALTICRLEIPDYNVKSFVKVVQDSRIR